MLFKRVGDGIQTNYGWYSKQLWMVLKPFVDGVDGIQYSGGCNFHSHQSKFVNI